jgi:hypothetical protein
MKLTRVIRKPITKLVEDLSIGDEFLWESRHMLKCFGGAFVCLDTFTIHPEGYIDRLTEVQLMQTTGQARPQFYR